MALTPAYSGQPFDAVKRRAEILQSMQDGVLSALRQSGAVTMTTGVTRPVSASQNPSRPWVQLATVFLQFVSNISREHDRMARSTLPAGPDGGSED